MEEYGYHGLIGQQRLILKRNDTEKVQGWGRNKKNEQAQHKINGDGQV